MPRFAANLSMMFTEVDFLDRFGAAARAGFNRDVDPRHFHAESAALARQRTLAFLAEHSS